MKINKATYNKHVKLFENGTTIFNEGDEGQEMYVIIDGSVEIQKSTSASSSKTLITLSNGDIFGEMALIENKKRSASAIAAKKTKLLVLNDHLFETMLGENPDFARKMIKMLSERLRRTNYHLQHILGTNKQKQIYNGLMQYIEKYGVDTYKGKRINLAAFIKWTSQHLGLSINDIKYSMNDFFIKKGLLKPSALGNGEYIVSSIKVR
jgi:CRP/FNR family transcriptional regulator, cyclic AMP receptor protein